MAGDRKNTFRGLQKKIRFASLRKEALRRLGIGIVVGILAALAVGAALLRMRENPAGDTGVKQGESEHAEFNEKQILEQLSAPGGKELPDEEKAQVLEALSSSNGSGYTEEEKTNS